MRARDRGSGQDPDLIGARAPSRNFIKDESYASEVGDTCRENGLLVSAEDSVLMLFPALTISRQTAQRGLDIFEKSL